MILFNPKSVAVVGASRDKNKVGHKILKNILADFRGKIYPVNPKAKKIGGLTCYPTIGEIPGKVDLAVVAIPSVLVPGVLEECGRKKIGYVVVISSGFKETGASGAELERECLGVVRKYSMRMVGPNCLGVIDTSSGLNATFATKMPCSGNIAFMSQSGALCSAILDWADVEEVGFSKFISLGNKADLGENEFLGILEKDENTAVILAYLEGLKDGRKFMKLGKRISKKKPVIILKSGRTSAGKKAVASHTGTLAGSDNAYNALFRQCGVLRADSGEELFDYAVAFSHQPTPKNSRVAVVTNAGGPGIMATDACEKAGLELASFSRKTINFLRKNLPPAANIYNPVDLLGDARSDRYSQVLEVLLRDRGVDVVMVLLTPQAMTDSENIAESVGRISKKYSKPVLCGFMGGSDIASALGVLREVGIPNYPYPERAAKTIKGMVDYQKYKTKKYLKVERFRVDAEKVCGIISEAVKRAQLSLISDSAAVLEAYGIPTSKSHVVSTLNEAVSAAQEIGYPVALKIISPDIIHKSDIGGVILDVTEDGIKTCYNKLMRNVGKFMPDARIQGVMVQEMVSGGREVILGVNRDPQLGPVLMFGLGGIYIEVLKDVSFRIAPINRAEACEMVSEVSAYRLLQGVRGEQPSDIESIVDCLLRLSQLSVDHPQIAEVDVNPLKVFEEGKGCKAVDARIILGGTK